MRLGAHESSKPSGEFSHVIVISQSLASLSFHRAVHADQVSHECPTGWADADALSCKSASRAEGDEATFRPPAADHQRPPLLFHPKTGGLMKKSAP